METTTTHPEAPAAPAQIEGTVPVIREFIGIQPGYCGGKPHILGHRIKVELIATMHEEMGMTPAQIVDDLPTIDLAMVHSALAYYYSHREEIDADIREGDEFVEKLRAGQPSILERARREDAPNDPVSHG